MPGIRQYRSENFQEELDWVLLTINEEMPIKDLSIKLGVSNGNPYGRAYRILRQAVKNKLVRIESLEKQGEIGDVHVYMSPDQKEILDQKIPDEKVREDITSALCWAMDKMKEGDYHAAYSLIDQVSIYIYQRDRESIVYPKKKNGLFDRIMDLIRK